MGAILFEGDASSSSDQQSKFILLLLASKYQDGQKMVLHTEQNTVTKSHPVNDEIINAEIAATYGGKLEFVEKWRIVNGESVKLELRRMG
jgi:hypothetical protein